MPVQKCAPPPLYTLVLGAALLVAVVVSVLVSLVVSLLAAAMF